MKTIYDNVGWAIGDIAEDFSVYHYGTDEWYFGSLTEAEAEQKLLDLEYDLK